MHRLGVDYPQDLAVDFFAIGSTVKVVDNYNAAVANVTGTTALVDQLIDTQRSDPKLSDKDRADLDQLKRLPFVSAQDALALLGPVADKLQVPQLVKDLQEADEAFGAPSSSSSPSTPSSRSSSSQAPTSPSTGRS